MLSSFCQKENKKRIKILCTRPAPSHRDDELHNVGLGGCTVASAVSSLLVPRKELKNNFCTALLHGLLEKGGRELQTSTNTLE